MEFFVSLSGLKFRYLLIRFFLFRIIQSCVCVMSVSCYNNITFAPFLLNDIEKQNEKNVFFLCYRSRTIWVSLFQLAQSVAFKFCIVCIHYIRVHFSVVRLTHSSKVVAALFFCISFKCIFFSKRKRNKSNQIPHLLFVSLCMYSWSSLYMSENRTFYLI